MVGFGALKKYLALSGLLTWRTATATQRNVVKIDKERPCSREVCRFTYDRSRHATCRKREPAGNPAYPEPLDLLQKPSLRWFRGMGYLGPHWAG